MNPQINTLPRSSRWTATAVGLLCLCVVFAVGVRWGAAAADEKPYVDQHYPDFGFLPPPTEYKGRVFRLSQKYPTTEPDKAQRPAFLQIDFQKNWREYLLAAQDYCFHDNVLNGDVADGLSARMEIV